MVINENEKRLAIEALLIAYAVLLAVSLWPPAAIPVVAVWIGTLRE